MFDLENQVLTSNKKFNLKFINSSLLIFSSQEQNDKLETLPENKI